MRHALALVLALVLLAAGRPAGAAEPWTPPPLPEPPAAPVVRPEDCPALDLYPDQVVPQDLSGCRGVVVTAGESDAVEELVADDLAVRQLYQVATLQLQVERDSALTLLEQATPRWWERPAVCLALGGLVGAGLTLGAGYVAVQAWAP